MNHLTRKQFLKDCELDTSRISSDHPLYFSAFDRILLCLRVSWSWLSLSIPVPLASMSYLVATNFLTEYDCLDTHQILIIVALTSFMISAIFVLGVDSILHIWISSKLLAAVPSGSIVVKNASKLLRIWFAITSGFLVIEVIVVSLLSHYLYNIVGVVVMIIPGSHFVSFLTLVYYIIRVDRHYIVEADSKKKGRLTSGMTGPIFSIVVPPADYNDSLYNFSTVS